MSAASSWVALYLRGMEKIRFLYRDMRAAQACSSPLKHSCTKRESLHVSAGAVAPGDDRSLRIRALTLMDEQIGQKQASHCLLSPLPSFLAGSPRFGGTLFRKKRKKEEPSLLQLPAAR